MLMPWLKVVSSAQWNHKEREGNVELTNNKEEKELWSKIVDKVPAPPPSQHPLLLPVTLYFGFMTCYLYV